MTLKRYKLSRFLIRTTGEENVQSDWNQSNDQSDDFIKNKPTIPSLVQSDWNQANTEEADFIKNKPTIPSLVQSDWNQANTESADFIKNKPNIQGSIQTPSGTAIAFNVNNGKDAIITLSGNTILTFSNLTANDKGNFIITGHASVAYTLTIAGATVVIPSASHNGGDTLLLSGAGKKDLVSWWYTSDVLVVGLAKDLI